MSEKKAIFISDVVRVASYPIMFVSRFWGLFPFTLEKKDSCTIMRWSRKSFVRLEGPLIVVISTIRGMVNDLEAGSDKSIRMKQSTGKYVTVVDISIVALVVFVGIFGTPFRVDSFLSYVSCINESRKKNQFALSSSSIDTSLFAIIPVWGAEMLAIYLISATSIAMLYLYYYFKKKMNFWADKGVITQKSVFPFGNAKPVIFQKESTADSIKKLYEHLRSQSKPYGGYYFLTKPVFVPVDLELIRRILIVDFDYFTDRLFHSNESEPLSNNLVSYKGNQWKQLRSKLSPAFTPSKIKMLFPTIMKSTDKLICAINEELQISKVIDINAIVKKVSIDITASSSFGLQATGYETTASLITFCLYELSLNQEMQCRAREELNIVLAKHNGDLSYDALLDLQYLDKIIRETLRVYPPIPTHLRVCTKDYKVPNSDVVIEKGTAVLISVLGIHHDPDYYKNPGVFNPERFSDVSKIRTTWIPFGDGPRNCIGSQLGLLQSKLVIVSFLKNYKFSLSPNTQRPVEINKKIFVLRPLNPIWFNVEKIA
ncbi:hypothetical protein FQA39_LY16254 [Lamprigera yunnana]|nr:hypothetical protein FQA39_LY16254 [Lamprigera yunnana]